MAAAVEQNPSVHEGVSGTFQAAMPGSTTPSEGRCLASHHTPAGREGRALHSWSSCFRARPHSHYTSCLLSDQSTLQTTALPCCLRRSCSEGSFHTQVLMPPQIQSSFRATGTISCMRLFILGAHEHLYKARCSVNTSVMPIQHHLMSCGSPKLSGI